jgi:hypothetical protein
MMFLTLLLACGQPEPTLKHTEANPLRMPITFVGELSHSGGTISVVSRGPLTAVSLEAYGLQGLKMEQQGESAAVLGAGDVLTVPVQYRVPAGETAVLSAHVTATIHGVVQTADHSWTLGDPILQDESHIINSRRVRTR